ncbi:substrate-binding domain-containing protein [Heyndrickxia acidicola]|uniref:Substrate-binding domain-containing protein n=1 Tax=Heyndrickxia acidicola TaxID=209389 RepID=A0ABU6MLK7_9BACI|nr:substrate-binding domain-containing protein [Heyndrickxia acidicola]MED1205561.1 substrate-binding domain-containing protein [Heyndrickxia acidicola]
MKSKLINSLIGVSSLMFLMTACSSNSSSTTTSAIKSTGPIKMDFGQYCGSQCQDALKLNVSPDSIKGKVGMAIASTTFPYGVAIKNESEAFAKKYFPNMQLLVADGQNDPSVQSGIVDDFIAKGINVLIINAVEKAALAPAVKRAEAAGIKVIEVDRTVNAPVLTTIKANDIDLGIAAGKDLATRLHGKGNVVEIQGSPSASPTIDRHKGFMEALKDYPGIKVIASQNADYDQSKGLSVMEDLLQRFPKGKIDAVFSQADIMTLGAIQAIKNAGRNEIKVISIDGQQAAFNDISNGTIDSTTVYPVIAPMDIIAAAKALAGEKLPSFIKLDSPTVTKENVSKYNGTTY